MKWLYKKPSVVYFWMRIHKSNSCFPWNRNNVIRAISNNYCEVGCNSFADFPLLSRYSDVHQISWPLFLKALACLHSSPLGRTVVSQFVLPDFFLHKIIIFSCNFNWPQVTTFCYSITFYPQSDFNQCPTGWLTINSGGNITSCVGSYGVKSSALNNSLQPCKCDPNNNEIILNL